jgi:TonB-linked SusC/RagA family outer membrane protein
MTLGYNNLQLGKEQFTKSEAWDEALLYQMLRVNYKYLDRYLLTATARRDGFSGFAENNKFAIFPSVAVGWIISEEKFFKLSWVDQLKLRAGWGISGNQTSRYKSLARMESNSGYVFGDGGTTEILQKVNSMGNPDLKWEKTEGFNFGLDFNLFNNRLTGSLEAYRTITRDLLYDMTIPSMTGFSSISTNIGKIRNRGVELTLTSRNFVQKDFEWSTTFNISSNSNKILSLLGRDQDGDGREDDLTASNLFIGESTSAIYGYIIDGIYQLHDDIPAGYNPGNYKIRDVTGEGKITVDDRVILGKEDPAYRFSLLNTFRWKDFTFSFFINSVQGGKHGYLGKNTETLVRGDANSRRWNRISELAKDYWSPNNPDGTYSRSINAGAISPTAYQDRSFIRLQDVTLGYNLPQKWVRTIGLQNLNLYVNGKNLLTFTNWKGWDPETNGGYFSTPVMRSFTFGLNITL